MRSDARSLFSYVALLLLSGFVFAGESNYQRLFVANRVSIEVPKHWQVLDIDQRRNIAAASDALGITLKGRPPVAHVAALAVNATPSPPGAIVRVSMIQTDPLSQADLIDALANDRVGTISDLRRVFRQEMSGMSEQMQRQGLRMLGQEQVSISSIGGKTAIAVSYRRTSLSGASPFRVTQFHVSLGTEKALITLSFRESDQIIYSQIIDYIKNSISIE